MGNEEFSMCECTKCKEHKFGFKRKYQPCEFIEGKKDSRVWIVGLNPAEEPDWVDDRTITEREKFLNLNDWHSIPSYFKDFRSVSTLVFEKFGKDLGTAHTDIVKCSSRAFPKGKVAHALIKNCKGFLEEQIKTYKPRIIVCNGVLVSKFMLEFLRPPHDYTNGQTSYWSEIDGFKICVVLSGFIGRIDNFAKRRLGMEIESRLCESAIL
jgi:uracil-DNA glycosylase